MPEQQRQAGQRYCLRMRPCSPDGMPPCFTNEVERNQCSDLRCRHRTTYWVEQVHRRSRCASSLRRGFAADISELWPHKWYSFNRALDASVHVER